MSLNLKGDVTSNTGEYLPAPYIDQVVVEGDLGQSTSNFKYSVFLQEEVDRDVWGTDREGSTGVVTAAEAYQVALENNVYVYTIEFWNMAATGFYEDIVDGKINPLALLHLSGAAYIDANRSPSFTGPGRMEWSNAGIPDWKVEIVYDEDGNPVSKYFTEVSTRLTNDPSIPESEGGGTYPNGWAEVDSFRAIAFTSTIDVVNDLGGKSEAEINIPLLNIQTSDISHIKVIENGELMNRYLSEYIDDSGVIYNDIPLIAIDSLVYKPDKATHEQIVANFQDLIDQYSGEYQKKENAKFKRMVDKISFILEVYGEEADLLVQLDALRRIFPDKTPAKLIGKFYKRFRKRISNVNKVIKKGPPLTRKIIYNAKIVDLRPTGTGYPVTDLGYDSEPAGENYIYKDWNPSEMEIDMGPAYSNSYNVIAGHFFFDYEKALRRTSNISEIFDINKLEKWGIHIPYSFFGVWEIYANRIGYKADQTPTGEDIDIGCVFQLGQEYPIIDYSYVTDRSSVTGDYVIVDPEGETYTDNGTEETYGFFDTPYGPPGIGSSNWAGGGYVTSLVLRHYVNPYNSQFSTIDNYRLMCYELLDYQKDSGASEYTVNILINDNTSDVIDALIQSASDAYALLIEYKDYSDHECSFNEDIGVFNSFFGEAMMAQYPDPVTAPWYAAPVKYFLHVDLVYDTYGGDIDKITKAAQEISQQINPVTGTRAAIDDFQAAFEDFKNSAYGTDSTIAAVIESQALPGGIARNVEFETTIEVPFERTASTVMSTYQKCSVDDECTVEGETCESGYCKFVDETTTPLANDCMDDDTFKAALDAELALFFTGAESTTTFSGEAVSYAFLDGYGVVRSDEAKDALIKWTEDYSTLSGGDCSLDPDFDGSNTAWEYTETLSSECANDWEFMAKMEQIIVNQGIDPYTENVSFDDPVTWAEYYATDTAGRWKCNPFWDTSS